MPWNRRELKRPRRAEAEVLEVRLLLSGGLQPGWSDQDIGSPPIAGSASYDTPSDTYTISGNGSDIFGTSDQFNFASTTMSGDGSDIAYVNSITDTDPWAKAGVMIRNDSSAGSAFAGLFVSAENGITFEYRASAGGETDQEINAPAGGPVPAPVGLKLTRAGNSFTAFYSTDGMNWIQVGPAQTATIGTAALAGLAVTSHKTAALATATFSSVSTGSSPFPGAGIYSSSDQLFLNDLEQREVMSFYDDTNPNTGLIPDNESANGGSPSSDSSIAAIGFGLTALTIGDARGWLTDSAAYQRALTTINFLYNDGATFNGFFYHFLNETTGARFGTSEVSSVDTAELMAGVLTASQYWAGTPLQTAALNLYDRVNWPAMQMSSGIFYGAWTPESGFSGNYADYSEASLLYLMGLGSPTHPITQSSWLAWSRTPVVKYDGFSFITADDAALFTVQYPMAWFNLQGDTDSRGLNYYQNAQTATLAQRQMSIDLSSKYSDFGPNLWGLTPSEGVNGYTAWGGPPATGPIDGTVVPAAPGGSLEFEPRLSLNVLENMKQTYGSTVYQKYGLVDAFNPLTHWTSSRVLGIDVGMMLIAAENSRSNLVWNTFMQTAAAKQAMFEAFPPPPPSPPIIINAVSRKTGAGGTSNLPLNLSGTPSVEPRVGGPTQIVLTYSSSVVIGSNFSITSTNTSGGADGSLSSISTGGSMMTVNLSGATDGQILVLQINDVRINSTAPSGDYTLDIGVLMGDANEDGGVNAGDFDTLAGNYGGSGKNYSQGDLNDDGIVNTADFNLLASQFNKSLAASATTSLSAPAALVSNLFSTSAIPPSPESLLDRNTDTVLN